MNKSSCFSVKLRAEWTKMGKRLPPKKNHWDSNVITPGTEFMAKLAENLRYYIAQKMQTEPLWENLKVNSLPPQIIF